ncbi:MAG: spherulation-specific family 4 protein [Anaerolineales bacterium]
MKIKTLLLLSVFLLSLLPPFSDVQAQSAVNYSLRFFGHGNDNIDRLRIPIDPHTVADVGTDFTLEFWLRALPGENAGTATCGVKDGWITGNTIFDRDIFGPADYGDWGISLSNGRIAFGITKGSKGTTLCGRANVADGTWHHIAVTRRASDGLMRIFVDGWLDAQRYGPTGNISYRNGRSTPYENDPYLVIGAEKHDAGPEFPSFSGWLDEIRLSSGIRYSAAFQRPSAPFSPDTRTLFLYHFDEASGEGACNPTIPDAAGRVDAECRFGGDAPAGPVYSLSSPFAAQRIAIPAYFDPGPLWDQLTNAAPTVGLAVINPAGGPGSASDPAYLTTVQQAQTQGITVLGYVATGYGRRSATTVKQEIQRYFTWYGVNGIFLDEASTSCLRQPYYLDLYRFIKKLRPGARVVINPGTNTAECYMKAADIIVNFENTYSAYESWMPATWVYKYPAARFWHLVIAADQSQMVQAVQFSKARHAGWVYVTPDDLPNPWDSLPEEPYWSEQLGYVNPIAGNYPSCVAVRLPKINLPEFSGSIPFEQTAITWFGYLTPTQNYADIRAGYNADELYVYIAAFDRHLWHSENPSVDDLTEWDAVTLLLDTQNNTSISSSSWRFIAQLSGGPDDRYRAVYQGGASGWQLVDIPFQAIPGWRGNALNNNSDTDRGWAMGFSIPFTSLGLAGKPATGTLWRMAVILHDRDSYADTFIPDQAWPTFATTDSINCWGQLHFGIPTHQAIGDPTGYALIRRPTVNSPLVPDADVGGTISNQCPGDDFHIWNIWANRNDGRATSFNIQNQSDVADWPCFAKYYVTFPLDSIPAGKQILSARLTLYQFGNAGAPGQALPSWIQVLIAERSWQEQTITWNNAPRALENIGGAWVDPILDFPGWPGVPRTWDVSYAVAQAYAQNQPLRLILYSADSAYHSGKYFVSSDTDDWNTTGRPTLEVWWSD